MDTFACNILRTQLLLEILLNQLTALHYSPCSSAIELGVLVAGLNAGMHQQHCHSAGGRSSYSEDSNNPSSAQNLGTEKFSKASNTQRCAKRKNVLIAVSEL